ncbi:MAG: ATP-binding protein [Lentisphaeria bacterium]|nr:ATP-binding protein [Victivallales bacterium]MCR4572503.1 ATP-binding protein [Lentisphaeria bacterium]
MKKALEEILGDFYEHGVQRDVRTRSTSILEKEHSVSVVTGMRRTGKTYLTYQRMQELLDKGIPLERIVHVSFDDERLGRMTVNDLHLVNDLHAAFYPDAARQKCWYFLDELQNIEGWELYVRRLLDTPQIQVCLTGSSSRLLSSEISTQLRGRSLETELFPLSFAEFLTYNNIFDKLPSAPYSSRTVGRLKNAMGHYLEEGGFPDVQGTTDRIRIQMLQGYVQSVLYRDVLERHEVPSVQALQYTLDYLLYNYARKASTRAISGALKFNGVSSDREAIGDYLRYFKEAYLVYPVSLRTESQTIKNANPDKFYIVDMGLIRAMQPRNDAERGWLMENLVFLSLRRGFQKIEYYNCKEGGEIDFYVTDKLTHGERLVQVCWEMADKVTFNREFSAIKAAMKETGIQDATIVTWDDDECLLDDVRVVPVWKWVLEEANR